MARSRARSPSFAPSSTTTTSGDWRVAKDFSGLPAWIVKAVGGTTVHWAGASLRFQEHSTALEEDSAASVHHDLADVRIEDRYASGVHARLYSRGASYYVEDMNSTNGTFLNGGRLEGEAELKDLDQIRIGGTEFRFELDVPEG